jgi:hypothetical protein
MTRSGKRRVVGVLRCFSADDRADEAHGLAVHHHAAGRSEPAGVGLRHDAGRRLGALAVLRRGRRNGLVAAVGRPHRDAAAVAGPAPVGEHRVALAAPTHRGVATRLHLALGGAAAHADEVAQLGNRIGARRRPAAAATSESDREGKEQDGNEKAVAQAGLLSAGGREAARA